MSRLNDFNTVCSAISLLITSTIKVCISPEMLRESPVKAPFNKSFPKARIEVSLIDPRTESSTDDKRVSADNPVSRELAHASPFTLRSRNVTFFKNLRAASHSPMTAATSQEILPHTCRVNSDKVLFPDKPLCRALARSKVTAEVRMVRLSSCGQDCMYFATVLLLKFCAREESQTVSPTGFCKFEKVLQASKT